MLAKYDSKPSSYFLERLSANNHEKLSRNARSDSSNRCIECKGIDDTSVDSDVASFAERDPDASRLAIMRGSRSKEREGGKHKGDAQHREV